MTFSDYVVYADESGAHSLTSINPQNPTFALAFCIFEKRAYVDVVVPFVQRLKFEFFGHDCVVLHGAGQRADRATSGNRDRRRDRQAASRQSVQRSRQPYEIALAFCMERLQRWLEERGQDGCLTHLMVERRGAAEDAKLELEFRRIVNGRHQVGRMQNLDIRFMDKKHNSTGLQVADLFAQPIARHVINPAQANRAYELIEPKFRRSAAGQIADYGLKTFP